MHPSDLVLRFLASIGRPAEAEFYLRQFRAERRQSFAAIAVSDSVMRAAPDALAVDLRFLSRLGLAPVVVFGLVDPSSARAHAGSIRDRLEGDAPCEVAGGERAGELAAAGTIPLVPGGATAGDAGDPSDDPIDRRFAALADLVTRLQTRKLVFLGRRSGLQLEDGRTLSLVDLTTEYAHLAAPGVLAPKQAALLRQIDRLLAAAAHRMTAAVTSPIDLLRELFTERGAGTLVRRGSAVSAHRSFAGLDLARLRALLESAFGRSPHERLFEREVDRIYVADDYRGAAVVIPTPLGGYLSKFAVDPQARGEGVGRDLWRTLTREVSPLIWRARPDNPITPWYLQNCDGMARTGPWQVFWRGLPEGRITDAIDYARSAPEDFPGR